MASMHQWTLKMTPQDKSFYQQLGQRIAQFRKDRKRLTNPTLSNS